MNRVIMQALCIYFWMLRNNDYFLGICIHHSVLETSFDQTNFFLNTKPCIKRRETFIGMQTLHV